MDKTCYIIFIYLIIDLISFTVILPLIPSMFDYYEENDQVFLDFVCSLFRTATTKNYDEICLWSFFGCLIIIFFLLLIDWCLQVFYRENQSISKHHRCTQNLSEGMLIYIHLLYSMNYLYESWIDKSSWFIN